MAKLTIDLSGRQGLLERHQGDLNDSTSTPNLRYLGEQGQFADGVFNPFKKYGFLSPANNNFLNLTGSFPDVEYNSIQYDAAGDTVYLSTAGEEIVKLAGLDDTTLANHLTLTTGTSIKDMVMYEINGTPALFYLVDSNQPYYQNTSTSGPDEISEGGMYLGFKTLDTSKGIEEGGIDMNVSTLSPAEDFYRTINVDGSTTYGRRLAQSFTTTDSLSGVKSNQVSGVKLKLRRNGGTGAGVTFKVSIQANQSPSTSPFTSRGAWSNAVTNYVVNDTVTNAGYTWQCIAAHSAVAAANDEPGVGNSHGDYWDRFGSPDGTDIASGTFLMSDILDDAGLVGVSANSVVGYNALPRTTVTFSSIASLSPDTTYWIVLQEVGANMSASDKLTWRSTINGDATTVTTDVTTPAQGKIYQTGTPWRGISYIWGGGELDVFDYGLILNRDDDWSSTSTGNPFGVDTGSDGFLHVSDNNLLYWFAQDKVHTADGSVTGGFIGKMNENVLQFPSYMTVTDVAETRSRMYIGVQTSNRVTPSQTSEVDYRYYTAETSGVFVWDRKSQVLGSTDLYAAPGAKEIKSLFQGHDGSVYAITESNSGFSELRTISGNQFAVIQTFEKQGFPRTRRSVVKISSTLTVWIGANGIIYAYGVVTPQDKPALFKIGSFYNFSNNYAPGPLFVGNKVTDISRLALLIGGYNDSTIGEIWKWYPNGEGTIDSVAQKAAQGNVYTMVYTLPSFSDVQYINIFGIPTSSTATDTIATVKIYFNMSTTPWASKVIRKLDMNKGYIEIPVNKQNINFVQFEIEWSTTETLGADTFCPMYAEIEVKDVETTGGKKT